MNRTSLHFLKVLASTCIGLPVAFAQWGGQNPNGGSTSRGGDSDPSRYQSDYGPEGGARYSTGQDNSTGGYGRPESTRQAQGTLWFTQSYPAGAQPIQKGSPGSSGLWEVGFKDASTPLSIGTGDEVFCWVKLDSSALPREIMLSFNDGSSWEHRAFWGQDLITYGKENSPGRMNAGSLPQNDGWIKLTVPASSIGLTSRAVSGMTVSLEGGQAQFGAVGAEPQGTGQYGYGPLGQPGGPRYSSDGGYRGSSQNGNSNENGSGYNRDDRSYRDDRSDRDRGSSFPGDSRRGDSRDDPRDTYHPDDR